MIVAKHNPYLRILFVLLASSSILSCDSPKGKSTSANLLAITVEDSQIVDHAGFNRRLQTLASNLKENNLYSILSEIWFVPNAHYSVISINKVKHDRMNVYAATLIFDNVPDDDSVSGYRYDIQLNNHLPGRWELTEVRESWRCWEGRGHRVFSVSPCS